MLFFFSNDLINKGELRRFQRPRAFIKASCVAPSGALTALRKRWGCCENLGLWWDVEEAWLEKATFHCPPNLPLPRLEADGWKYPPYPGGTYPTQEALPSHIPRKAIKENSVSPRAHPRGLRMAWGTAWPHISSFNKCYTLGLVCLSSKGREQIIRWLKKRVSFFVFIWGFLFLNQLAKCVVG